MVRWKRPHVPQPGGTPLPATHLSEEERGRICSVYLRPWVLSTEYASAHVPLLADIDVLVSDVLGALQTQLDLRKKTLSRKRIRSKQEYCGYNSWKPFEPYPNVDSNGQPFDRSYAKAWTYYRRGHVVSK